MLLILVLPVQTFATKTDELSKAVEEANREKISYYKEGSSTIIHKSQEQEITIETVVDDISLQEEKEAALHKELYEEGTRLMSDGMDQARTFEEFKKALTEVESYITEKEDAFDETKEEFLKEKVEMETRNVIMISAHYKTVKDSLFTTKHHAFYYYDPDEKVLIPNDKVRTVPEVEAFEKESAADIVEDNNYLNSFYVVLLLAVMCFLPYVIGSFKKHLART